MDDNQPSLRVPAYKTPTFWNKEAAVGFILASIPGLVIGGMMGKSRMEREEKDGKIVSPPSFWNKDLIIGFGIGGWVGAIAYILLAGALLSSTPPALLVAAVTGITLLAGPLIGAVMGANHGKAEQAKEYARAKDYVRQHGEFNPYAAVHDPVQQSARAHTLTPQEAATLEARLNNSERSFAKSLESQPAAIQQR